MLPGAELAAPALAKTPQFLRHFVRDQSGSLFDALQQLIDDLPEEIAVLDGSCTILAVNRTWQRTMETHGHLESMPPSNYRDLCANIAQGYRPAAEALSALDDICSGKRSFWQLIYNGGERWHGHDFQICFHRIIDGGQLFILVTRFDLTEILELRRLKDELGHAPVEPHADIPVEAERRASAGPAEDAQAVVAATMQQLLDDLPEQIALLDEDFNILSANRAWKDTVERHGYVEALPGRNYRDFCLAKAAEGYEPAIEAAAALDDIRVGKRNFWQLLYNGRERWDGHDFQICFHRVTIGNQRLISVTRSDLTELLELRRFKHDFTNSLIEGQAIERQRMARELHDSTSQLLTGIGLVLGRLEHESQSQDTLGLIGELRDLVGEAHREIRSISYLAHPPALKELGLAEAMKSLLEGFGRRTGLEASFEICGDLLPMPTAAESTIYRVAQEALSNVHRHARATRVRLMLCVRDCATHLLISDNGIGIPDSILEGKGSAGVGLAGMHSRLAELGGRLSVRLLHPGTAIVATLPNKHRIGTGEDIALPAFG